MNALDLLQWGEIHHYPQLVLISSFPCDILHSGRTAWYALVEGGDTQRLQRALARVEYWQGRFAVQEQESEQH